MNKINNKAVEYIDRFAYAVISGIVPHSPNKEELYRVMKDEISSYITEDFLDGEVSCKDFVPLCNEVGRILWKRFGVPNAVRCRGIPLREEEGVPYDT